MGVQMINETLRHMGMPAPVRLSSNDDDADKDFDASDEELVSGSLRCIRDALVSLVPSSGPHHLICPSSRATIDS